MKGGQSRKMSSTEKTPVLYCNDFNKTLYEEKKAKKCRSKSFLGWFFITILILFLILLIIQIVCSPFDQGIRFWSEHAVDYKTVSPRFKSPLASKEPKVNYADPWNLDFLIDPSHLCATHNPPDSDKYANDPEVKLLMIVPSAVDHFEQRRAIRNTWGSVAKSPLGPMRLAFILGTTTNNTVDHLIHEESSVHRDIIQADFVDGYHQLTTKGIAMLKWVAKRCPHAQYFLKADDDAFVNLLNIAHMLSYEPYVSAEKFISGNIQTTAKPQRIPQEEFYISIDEYPGEEYPPYASGSTYVMTIPTATQLFQACQEVKPLLPKDDVFLTGLCAQHIAAPLIHEPSFVTKDPPRPPSWETFSPFAAVHSVTPDILESVWTEMTLSHTNNFQTMQAAINGIQRMKKSV